MMRSRRARGTEVPPILLRARLVGFGLAVGAIASHLFDPDRGHARRARARDQLAAGTRRVRRRTGRATLGRAHHARDHVAGVARKSVHSLWRERPDDTTIAQKVRSEVLGTRAVHGVTVDASAGVVHLRGELASPALIDELTAAAAKVYGVERVESYLHLPGEPAPNKQSSPSSSNGHGS
jgi:osmotically-inducible protein OsmY